MDVFSCNLIDRLSKSYMETYQLGAENGNQENYEDPEKKQSFKDQIAKLCEIEQSLKDESNLIQNFECASVDDFDKEYKIALKEVKKNARKGEELERFLKFSNDIDNIAIQRENEGDETQLNVDEDVAMNDTQIVETDPISKMPIRDPVRNTLCQHVYDRETIEEAIRLNPRTRCPYLGCVNKQPVKKLHLQGDPVLKAKLTQLYTQRHEQEQDQIMDDDDEEEDDEE